MDLHPEQRRPYAIDTPPTDMEAASDLLADLERIRQGSESLMRRIESTTGLLTGEVQVLEAIAAGADHVRAVAKRTGQPVDAARVTIEGLTERNVVSRHRHQSAGSGGEPAMLHVTDAGNVVLGQVEAIRLRMTDALLNAFGANEAAHLRETAQTLSLLTSTEGPALAPGSDCENEGQRELPVGF